MDHKRFPKKLREQMYQYLREYHSPERKAGWTDQQFFYKLRKKAHAPFKRELWDLPKDTKSAIMDDLQGKFEFLFKQLGIAGEQSIAASALTESEPEVESG